MFETCEEVMGIADVAEVLHVGRGKVYELLQTGELKGWHPGANTGSPRGKTWRIPRDALIEYVNTQIRRKK